jgi:hypothetical protein
VELAGHRVFFLAACRQILSSAQSTA